MLRLRRRTRPFPRCYFFTGRCLARRRLLAGQVLRPLPVADQDLAVVEIDILHSEIQALTSIRSNLAFFVMSFLVGRQVTPKPRAYAAR